MAAPLVKVGGCLRNPLLTAALSPVPAPIFPYRWIKEASVTGSSRLADTSALIHPKDLGLPNYFVSSKAHHASTMALHALGRAIHGPGGEEG